MFISPGLNKPGFRVNIEVIPGPQLHNSIQQLPPCLEGGISCLIAVERQLLQPCPYPIPYACIGLHTLQPSVGAGFTLKMRVRIPPNQVVWYR
jgi:hypothetical protein